MSAATEAFDAAIAETSTWCSPWGYPGVAEFVARRDERIRAALARLDEPDLDNDDIDNEEFCPRCRAGVDSDEHHAKCVDTGHALDGEPAEALTEDERGPLPTTPGWHTDADGLTYLINETGDIEPGTRHYPAEASALRVTLQRERDQARLDRDDLLEDRATLRQACIEIAGPAAALADNSVEGHARAARTAAARAKSTINDLHALADRLGGYDHSEHPTPMGIASPKDYEAGIRVSGLEIRAILGPHP